MRYQELLFSASVLGAAIALNNCRHPREYAPGVDPFPARPAAPIKLTQHLRAGLPPVCVLGACRSLLFPKDRARADVDGLPIEEIMNAGPGVDLGLANRAFETAGTRFRMLLFGRSVIDPA